MENFHDLGYFENSNFADDERRVDEDRFNEKVDEDCDILPVEQKKKRQKKGKSKYVKIEDDDSKRNWTDAEVESLFSLKGEMQPQFIKNAKKQGVDMWLKLHSRLLCEHTGFKKTQKACKSKFNDLFKAYKDDKLANNISGESRHTFKYYNSMDVWYHENGSVLKHVSASLTDLPSAEGDDEPVEEAKAEKSEPTPPSTSKKGKSLAKIKYQESALELMGHMVVNSKDMAHSMKEANGFMSSLDKHMERLIEKL